jgi:hypothetical protein
MAPLLIHELLDRTHVIADMFERHVVEHDAAQHPEVKERISRVEQELFGLYNQIAGIE